MSETTADSAQVPTEITQATIAEPARGGYQFTDDVGTNRATLTVNAQGDAETVVFLNRYGGLFIPSGGNDSILNTSSLIDEPRVILPWLVSNSDWDGVVECVRSRFEPFHVSVTDSEPYAGDYIEAVIAGHPSNIGQPDSIGGLAPFRLDCGVLKSAVVFAFAELYGSDHERLCDIAVQEIAHAFGLDHEILCTDPMSYLGGCGEKHFRNEDAPCGERDERECACGEARQNSLRLLSERLGDAAAPDVAIVSPVHLEAVNPRFYVSADANDNVGIELVELSINGQVVQSRTTRPFVFEVSGHAPGEHEIAVTVYDSENQSTAASTVIVDPSVPEAPAPVAVDQLQAGLVDHGGGCNAAGSAANVAAMVLLLWFASLVRRRNSLKKRV